MGKNILGFTEESGVLIVGISSYFNDQVGEELLRHVETRLQQGIKSVVLDFSGCDVVNSPGVAALFDLAYKVKEEFRGRIAACHASQLVSEVFDAVGLSSVLQMYKSRAEALESAG